MESVVTRLKNKADEITGTQQHASPKKRFGLDLRLQAVAQQIQHDQTHVDIGSDDGRLLRYLLRSGRIGRGIAVEISEPPFQNSCRALSGLGADVRLGNGFEALSDAEAHSSSICGMGAVAMVEILDAYPQRVPDITIVQPNRQPELLRRWARRRGFHLVDEQIAIGHWPYRVLRFSRVDGSDPVYEGLDIETAELFGPMMIRRRDPLLIEDLRSQLQYLAEQGPLYGVRQRRRELIRETLDYLQR